MTGKMELRMEIAPYSIMTQKHMLSPKLIDYLDLVRPNEPTKPTHESLSADISGHVLNLIQHEDPSEQLTDQRIAEILGSSLMIEVNPSDVFQVRIERGIAAAGERLAGDLD
jgi:hypothetical protein